MAKHSGPLYIMCKIYTSGGYHGDKFSFRRRLVNQAMKIGRIGTKRETVTIALKEFIERRRQKKILDLMGTITFRDDWDYKKDRSCRESSR